MTQTVNNPFFQQYNTPFATPPFNDIKIEHYEPAFDEGIKQLEKEIQEIAENEQPATFENTIVALERSGKLLEKVSSVFFNVLNAEANDEMMDLSQQVSPKLSESSNNIFLNEKLFARIKNIYGQKEQLNLSTEDAKLLEDTFESFCVRGANLSPEDKEKYRKLSSELSTLNLRPECIERQKQIRTAPHRRKRSDRTSRKHPRSGSTQGKGKRERWLAVQPVCPQLYSLHALFGSTPSA